MRVLLLFARFVALAYIFSSDNQITATFSYSWDHKAALLISECQLFGTDVPCIGNYTGSCCVLSVTSDRWYLIIITPSTENRQPTELAQDHVNFMVVNLQQLQVRIVGLVLVDCLWCKNRFFQTIPFVFPLPPEICNMMELEFIFLDFGQWLIDSMCFANMSHLRFLGINVDYSTKIPLTDLLTGLPLLQSVHLNLHHTKPVCHYIQPSSQLFSTPVPLQVLVLDSFYTQVTLPPNLLHGLTSLVEVRLRANGFRNLHSNMFAGLSALNVIDLSLNLIQFLPVGLFDGLSSLTNVDVSSNRISYLNSEAILPLFNLATIKVIDLSRNQMKPYQTDSTTLTGMVAEWLDLWYDFFRMKESFQQSNFWNYSIVEQVLAEPSSVLIHMLGNRLETLHEVFSEMAPNATVTKHKYYISVHSDTFVCTCSDLNYFFQSDRFRLIDIGVTSCMSPDDYYNKKPFEGLVGNLVAEPKQHFSSTCDIVSTDCPPEVDCYIDLNKNAISITRKVNRILIKLPNAVPKLPQFSQSWKNFITSYHINCSHATIATLEPTEYLPLTSFVDLSFSGLSSISDRAARQLQSAHTIVLNDNLLTTVPLALSTITSNMSLRQIHLYNNRWSCDCQSLWMKHWLNNISSAVVHRNLIKCVTRDIRNDMVLMDLDDSLFRCGYILSNVQYTAVVVCGVCVSVAVVTAGVILLIHIKRHWIYTRFRLHPFDSDECVGEHMQYDVFLSYANDDEAFVAELITWLEHDNDFVACYHSRDFVLGTSIVENVERAVTRSKRTVCYVTDNYLRSKWCMWEFTMALNIDLTKNRHRLIVIKDDQLQMSNISNASLRAYMQRFTFVEQSSAYFNELLLYSLPQIKSHQSLDETNDSWRMRNNGSCNESETLLCMEV